MKMKSKITIPKRFMALMLSVIMIVGLVPASVFAAVSETDIVTAVTLPNKTEYTVENGTALTDSGLPTELTATVQMPATEEGSDATTREEVLAVTWEGAYDAATPGSYRMTAKFTNKATLAKGVSMPVVTVTVGEAVQALTLADKTAEKTPVEEAPAEEAPAVEEKSEDKSPVAEDKSEVKEEPTKKPLENQVKEEEESSVSPLSNNPNDLTISNPRLTLEKTGETETTSYATKGYFARIHAEATDRDNGVNGVWVGYRFTLQVPAGIDPNRTTFASDSYGWLMDLATGTTKAVPTYDTATRTITLEGKFYYDQAGNGLGSAGAQEYSRSISVATGLIDTGMTLTPTIETWVVDKENEVPEKANGTTITVKNSPKIKTDITNSKEIITGFYSASKNKAYMSQKAANADGATDAVQGRIYDFTTFATSSIAGNGLETAGIEPIKSGTQIKNTIPLTVTTKDGKETDPTLQPVLLSAHCDYKTYTGINDYNANIDPTFDKRVTDYSNTLWGEVVNGTMNVAYAGNVITATMNPDANYGGRGYMGVGGYYQVFVPIPTTDTDATKRNLVIGTHPETGDFSFDPVEHTSGQTSEEVIPTRRTVTVKADPIIVADFTGSYSRNVAIGWLTPDKMPIGSKELMTYVTFRNHQTSIAHEVTGFDVLLKVDADAYKVKTTADTIAAAVNGYGAASYKVQYGVLPAGGNWADDATMNATKKGDLTFYDAGTVPEGSTVVAILLKARGGRMNKGSTEFNFGSLIDITDDVTKAGEVYQMVMDIDIWNDETDPETDPIAASQPADENGGYKKPSFDDNGVKKPGTYEQISGDAVLLTGYVIGGGSSVNLNGTGAPRQVTTYDVSVGQRTADTAHYFKITNSGDATAENPDVEIPIAFRIMKGKWNANVDPDSVRLDATYIPGATVGDAGVIQGGIAPTKVTDDGWGYTFEFTVKGTGNHTVFASTKLGDPLDPDKDVPIGTINWERADAYGVGVGAKMMSGNSGSYLTAPGFTIVKSNAAGFKKVAATNAVKGDSEVQYRMLLSAQEQDLTGTFLLDILPFNNDGRGTSMQGSYDIQKPIHVGITTANTTVRSDLDVYYTTDKAIQSLPLKNVSDLKGTIFTGDTETALGVTWHKATRTDSANGFDFTVDPKSTAILSSGTVGNNESPIMDIYLQMKDMKTGDSLMNTAGFSANEFGQPIESSTASVSVAERKLEGKAWIDANNNGAQDTGETGLAGLTVKLYQGTKEITKDEDSNTYNVVTGTDGSYTFGKLPSSPEAYHVVFSGGDISKYTVSEKTAAGVTDNKNSDVTANPATGTMTSAISDKVYLLTIEQQAAQNKPLDVKQLDGGFVPYYKVAFTNPAKGGEVAGDADKLIQDVLSGKAPAAGVTATPENGEYIFTGWSYKTILPDGTVKTGVVTDYTTMAIMGNTEITPKFAHKPFVNIQTSGNGAVKVAEGTTIPAVGTATDDTYEWGETAPEPHNAATAFKAAEHYKIAGITVTLPNAGDKAIDLGLTDGTKTITGFTGTATLALAADGKSGSLKLENVNTSAIITVTYEKITYEVTFDTDGGNPARIPAQTIGSGDVATKPADPTKENLVFGGWFYTDADGNEAEWNFNDPIIGDVVLKAKWNNATSATVPVTGTKTLTGGGKDTADIQAGQFSFKVTRTDAHGDGVTGLPTADISVGEGGSLDFGTWSFNKEGTYEFTISENVPAAGYAKAADVTVTVDVTLNQATKAFEAAVTYSSGDAITFENVYTAPKAVDVALEGTKTLEGNKTTKDIAEGEFTFAVTADAGNDTSGYTGLNSEVLVKQGGAIDFGTLSFSKAGDYRFTIGENDLQKQGYTYDKTSYEVLVKVTLDETTNELKTKTTINMTKNQETKEADKITFANTYVPDAVESDPPVKKVVEGNPTEKGNFAFTMVADDKNFPMPEGSKEGQKEVSIQGAGEVEFGILTFTKEGTYTYQIAEKALNEKGYTYDKTVYNVTYVVTDVDGKLTVERTITANDEDVQEAVFTNIYKADDTVGGKPTTPTTKPTTINKFISMIKKVPKTGDTANMIAWGIMVLASGMVVIILMKRRKKQ